jgi:hypothetical protein
MCRPHGGRSAGRRSALALGIASLAWAACSSDDPLGTGTPASISMALGNSAITLEQSGQASIALTLTSTGGHTDRKFLPWGTGFSGEPAGSKEGSIR